MDYIAELQPGLSDDDVLTLAVTARRPILTEDRGFGELVFRQKRTVPGVIMLRLPAAEWAHWPRVVKLLQLHEKKIPGSYVVIDSKRLRMRPLPDPHEA